MFAQYLPCNRKPPSDGWALDFIGSKPQRIPRTQKGPLTAEQIETLRKSPHFAELEARTAAAQKVVPRMVAADIMDAS